MKVSKKGFKIAEVPIVVSYEGDTSTQNPISHGASVTFSTLKFISIDHPLKFYGIPGLVFLAIGWNGDRHEYFWPFGDSNYYNTIKDAYDFSEFLVYVLGPIVLLFSLNFIFEGNLENTIEDEIKKKK